MINETSIISTKDISALNKGFTIITSKIFVSIIIIFVGFVFGKIVEKALKKFFKSIAFDNSIKKLSGLRLELGEIITKIISSLIYLASVIMALDYLGIATNVINIVLWAVIIMIVISFFLSIKDIIPNTINGIVLLRKGNIKEGDKVRIDNIEGIVSDIDLTQTKLSTEDGDTIIVPNQVMMNKMIIKKGSDKDGNLRGHKAKGSR